MRKSNSYPSISVTPVTPMTPATPGTSTSLFLELHKKENLIALLEADVVVLLLQISLHRDISDIGKEILTISKIPLFSMFYFYVLFYRTW